MLPVPYYENELGRLYHGDCLTILPDLEPVDLVLTDPPYGIGADKKNAHSSIRDNPKWSESEWDRQRPTKEVFDEMLRVAKKVAIWGGNYFTDYLPVSSGWFVWVKPTADTGFSMADGELCWTSEKFSLRVIKNNKNYSGQHPTQKPVALMQWCLLKLSQEKNTVLDPFLGSGTTAVACERLKRRWIGIEISEEYCAIAVKRIEAERKQLKLF